ncbi:radical SAM domain-containing protein [Humibacillus sp. DSM 29435]|uniref:radical SAM domain-containing protein n=1 Tax=Humibacillus sp. DSM 29435 TaxID=1869167 RepID=UPI0008734952|nr:radical SAM domain-containing protein [Humibacillus sp. DSM 29435]OFE18061.1 radical SAM domain-containing protein [Humibacillus sp. DSM 29435]
MTFRQNVQAWVERTRPVDERTEQVLRDRWAALPEAVRTPEQLLGRHAVGCEGTHGVFPKCNLTCSPCYHSRDANKVRIDGSHTVTQIDEQMAYLAKRRGPRAHAQLIGGEVSLLAPDDHAAALLAMRAHGREPMSMTHGDFDYDYLEKVVLDGDRRVRLPRVSFAAHFDSLMRGRRGIPRPYNEAELDGYRATFVEMFARLRRETGVRSYLAHNMTVTPANLRQVASVVASVSRMGYQMLSFQPAAFVGDDRRWDDGYDDVDIDAVWEELEQGLGQKVSWRALQFGDRRCNRTAFGFKVGQAWHTLCEADIPAETAARDVFLNHFGGMSFGGTPPALLVAKVGRVLARHPRDIVVIAGWTGSVIGRVGGLATLVRAARKGEVTPMTFVVHQFMDAGDVAPAWEMLKSGVVADDERVRATQERLQACTYSMSHPETGELVPACAQHGVLDPVENVELRRLLPLTVLDQTPVAV